MLIIQNPAFYIKPSVQDSWSLQDKKKAIYLSSLENYDASFVFLAAFKLR